MFVLLAAYFLFITSVLAQTPSGFAPNVTAHLDVKFGAKSVTPGLALAKSETSKIPTIGTADAALTGSYIFFMIDLDVPGALLGGAAGSRVTNLHCLLTGWTSSTTATSGTYVLSTKDTSPKAYVAPAPPVENPPYAHKYVQLLYPQPADFKVPSSQTSAVSKGIGFNLTAFAIDAKLGAPVRANYFTVTG